MSLGGPQTHQSSKMNPAGTSCHRRPTTKRLHHGQLPAGARFLPEPGTKLGELALTRDAPGRPWHQGGCWWWPRANLPEEEDGSGMLHRHCRPTWSHRGSLLLTCGPFEADAVVGVVPVLAGAPIFAGLALALVDVDVAAVARVAGLAEAGEGGDAVLAGPVVARVRVTLIDVNLTVSTCETCQQQDRHGVRMGTWGGGHGVGMGDTEWGWGTLLPTLSRCDAVHWGAFTCPTVISGTPRSGVQAGSTPMCWWGGCSDPSPGALSRGAQCPALKQPGLQAGPRARPGALGGAGCKHPPIITPPAAPILLASSLPAGFGGGEPRTKYSFD